MKYSDTNKPIQCIMTNSTCYKQSKRLTSIKGVLWHDTGSNNPYIKRYVQPSDNDPNKDKLLSLLGKNTGGNDWNHIYRTAGVNFFVGKLADGSVSTVQALPLDWKPWGCGSGAKGTCNDGWIQFEICADDYTDRAYFEKVYKEACELTAWICTHYGLDPRGTVTKNSAYVPVVLCHQDSYKLGFGSNHNDVLGWFKKMGKTMTDVRNDVYALMHPVVSTPPVTAPTPVPTIYKTGVYQITASSLNVRSGAGSDYTKLGGLTNGTTVQVTAITNTKWGKIDYNGKVGYISLDYAKRIGDLPAPSPVVTTTPTTTASALIKRGQEEAKKFTGKTVVDGKNFAIDGSRGPQTRTMAAMVLQTGLNKAFNAGLAVDGSFGPKSKTALAGKAIKKGDKNYLVTAAEILLYLMGKDPNGVEYPGNFGNGLTKACGAEKIDANMFLSYLN